MSANLLAAAAVLALTFSAPAPAPAAAPGASKLTLLFTGDNWGELAPCG